MVKTGLRPNPFRVPNPFVLTEVRKRMLAEAFAQQERELKRALERIDRPRRRLEPTLTADDDSTVNLEEMR